MHGPWEPPEDGLRLPEVTIALLSADDAWRSAIAELAAIRRDATTAATLCADAETSPPLGSHASGARFDVAPLSPELGMTRKLLIIWDPHDARCDAVACALRHDFSCFCTFVDVRDGKALDQVLLHYSGLRRPSVCSPGRVTAVLPSGIYIPQCEEFPRALLHELRYYSTLRLPRRVAVCSRDGRWFAPLRAMRGLHVAAHGRAGEWYLQAAALKLVSQSLTANSFALVDGFLDPEDAAELREAVAQLYDSGAMLWGMQEQRGTHAGWSQCNEGDDSSACGSPRRWNLHGDYRAWCSDADRRAPEIGDFTRRLDALLSCLKDTQDSPGVAETSARLQRVDFREYAMATCYPGVSRARYLRHCDVSRGAVLTAILYLNEGWRPQDGGCLRLFWPHGNAGAGGGMRVKEDVAPVAGRLLLFWASEEVPHEVLAAHRDRFTISVWFKRSAEAMSGPSWTADLLLRHQPVRPWSLGEALSRAGVDEAVVQRLAWMASLLGEEPEEAGKLSLLRGLAGLASQAELRRAFCEQCGRQRSYGKMGTDAYAASFFCFRCWDEWQGDPSSATDCAR